MKVLVPLFLIAVLSLASNVFGDGNKTEYRPGGPKFKRTWDAFYAGDHEPELSIPLIKAGKKMTSAICDAVTHKDMKMRRYAIGALGPIGDRKALPTLETILKDQKEIDYFRGDALHAIYNIDAALARRRAQEIHEPQGTLKIYVDAVLKKEAWLSDFGSSEAD